MEMRIRGQGDYVSEAGENKQFPLNFEKEKKLRRTYPRESIKTISRSEEQKKNLNEHCFCFAKKEFSENSRHEAKEERKDFSERNYSWDSVHTNRQPENEKQTYSEQSKRNFTKVSPENILEFEEKVDFLCRVFKDCSQKSDDHNEHRMNIIFKDFLHLFDFNKRLSQAEEGIEKLTIILEDLIRKKGIENVLHSDQLDFEEMSMPQRINYLKNKNDLMLGFIKAFLRSSGFEDSCLRMRPKASDNDFDAATISPKLNFETSQNMKDIKQDGVMETLKNLRMRMQEVRPKKVFNEQTKPKIEKRWESTKNKLEVISEQAELALNNEMESGGNGFDGKSEFRSLQEKLSEIEKENQELPLSVTSRILAEEAEFLKSSIDKVHFELFSKPDSIIKKFGDSTNVQLSFPYESKKSDVEVNYDSSSEVSSVFWSDEYVDKSSELDSPSTAGRFLKQKEHKSQEQKEVHDKRTKDYCKTSSPHSESKLQNVCRIPQKSNPVISNKENRSTSSRCEIRSLSSAIEKNRDASPVEQKVRPMTDPNTRKKSPKSKPLTQDKCLAKNSGINNVKSKNKILLSKKSCVETS